MSTHSAENDAGEPCLCGTGFACLASEHEPVTPHRRCGIGTKREHEPHSFRALIMGGVVWFRCPGYVIPPEKTN